MARRWQGAGLRWRADSVDPGQYVVERRAGVTEQSGVMGMAFSGLVYLDWGWEVEARLNLLVNLQCNVCL